MTKEQLIQKLIDDSKYLESADIWNICLVKKIDRGTGNIIPDHITFNYWIDGQSVTVRLEIKNNGNYDVYYKSVLLIKNVMLKNIINKLSNYKVIVKKSLGGSTDIIELVRKEDADVKKRRVSSNSFPYKSRKK